MKTTLFAACLACTCAAHAATVIEAREPGGAISRITIEGDKARVDTPGMDGYMLVDMAAGRLFAVSDSERMIMDMTPASDAAAGNAPTGRLARVGKGPSIAGYDTFSYRLEADGQLCQRLDLSAEAMDVTGVRAFTQVMVRLGDADLLPGTGMAQMLSPCGRAEQAMQGEIAEHGLPLRVRDGSGRVVSQVTTIRTGVHSASGLFDLPPGYRRTNPQAMMQEGAEAEQQQNEILQQELQGLSPEQQELLRQMLEGN